MLTRIKGLSRSKFVKSVVIVATGTVAAQTITMATMPIVARLYGPEAFGMLGVFLAITTILTPIAALTYPTAIVLPKNDSDALNVAKLSILISFSLSLMAALLIIIAGDFLLKSTRSEVIQPYIMLIPFAMFFAALHQIVEQWLIRKKQFKMTAKIGVIQSIIVNGVKAGLGFINPLAAVLIIVGAFSPAINFILLIVGIKKNPNAKPANIIGYKPKTIIQLALEHKDFPIYRAPQVFINAASQSMPVLLLSFYFGPASAGFYALGKTVLGIPSALLGKAVVDVFYPRITEAVQNKEELYSLIFKSTKALAVIGIIPFALVFVFGPLIFEIVFGVNWVVAGEYARWLSLWLFFAFLNRPTVASIPAIGIQDFFLKYEVCSLLIRVGALVIGYYGFGSDLAAVISFSVAGVLLNFYLILATLSKAKEVQYV